MKASLSTMISSTNLYQLEKRRQSPMQHCLRQPNLPEKVIFKCKCIGRNTSKPWKSQCTIEPLSIVESPNSTRLLKHKFDNRAVRNGGIEMTQKKNNLYVAFPLSNHEEGIDDRFSSLLFQSADYPANPDPSPARMRAKVRYSHDGAA